MKLLKNRNKSPMRILICAAVLALLLWTASAVLDIFGTGGGREVLVNIPKGTGTAGIADILKSEGIIRHKLLFRMVEKSDRSGHIFQQGGHMLKSGMSYRAVIDKLCAVPEVSADETLRLLVPEGYEARQIAESLEKMGLAKSEDFLRELDEGEFGYDFIEKIDRRENRLEGYLFPATYEIGADESVHSIIDKMLRKFNEVVPPLYSAWDNPRGMTLDELVTLASMVEREAANDSERSRVASVFFNRMDRGMTLSSCATVQYILKERKTILSNSDVKIKSPYNTYINTGLPEGPIASPGEGSVRAAMNPEKSDYLYFAAKADGSANVFSKTGEEHMRVVGELQGKD